MAADGGRGKFITIEGGEGTGKSTQVRRLVQYLERAGLDVLQTREPGGAPGAEDIRRLLVEGEPGRWTPLTEALLHSAARADHLARLVRPALSDGKWVVCDRFVDSTTAYQGYGHGLPLDQIAALNGLVTAGTMPDLTVILDLSVAEGLKRAASRAPAPAGSEDRYERMAADFHVRLREGFREIARAEPERCILVDATGIEDAVAAAIADVVAQRLPFRPADLGPGVEGGQA